MSYITIAAIKAHKDSLTSISYTEWVIAQKSQGRFWSAAEAF